MKVHHYYHVWADGFWNLPATGHVAALLESGFPADQMTIGLAGSTVNRRGAEKWFSAELDGFAPLEFLHADSGFEQVTLSVMRERVTEPGPAVMYAHTKGAANISPVTGAVRELMTDKVVRGWRQALETLRDADAAGCFWARHGVRPGNWMSWEHEDAAPHDYFIGNFWWARSGYLRTLPEPVTESRYDAESWIGLRNPVVRDLSPDLTYPELVASVLSS